MAKTTYGRIRYIDNYADAPKSAEYILRQRNAYLSIILERYEGTFSTDLMEFSPEALFSEKEFKEVLLKCRKIVGPHKTIWVEKPDWMLEDFEEFMRKTSDKQ